ncbi:uncharacterized protein LOC133917893 [Phragmites australis]|uniref:uncharacterized protein LOC133917893 n=1 Tax=Phragmites australis TaxID=29695 RepID=UPI002D776F3A|nr:uncharacterized protein LOC133917893 [Phragmites australis]
MSASGRLQGERSPMRTPRRASSSPPPRRPRRRDGVRETVIERVVERSSAAIPYPILTRTNYDEWSSVVMVNLQAQGLWEVVSTGVGEYREDWNALAALLRAVPPEMQAGLARKDSAYDAWEAVKTIRVGVESVKEANAEKLRREFAEMAFKPSELVEEFTLRLQAVANQLRVLGDDVSDKAIVKRLLHSVPDHLEQVAISIETLMDLDIVSVEEVTGRLRAVEQRKKSTSAPVKDSSGRLLLTEEEWAARLKIRDGESSKGGSGSGNRRGGEKSRSRGSNGGGARDSNNLAQTGGAGPDDVCDYCGKKGHFAKVCRSKKRNERAQVHLAQEGDEHDEALLMAHGVVLNPAPAAHAAANPSPTPPPRRIIEIQEQRVFAQLGPREEREYKRWVLDTGATNHMTGARGAFSELDSGICGTMDEADCRVEINAGLLRIFDQQRQLLVKVQRSATRLYILEMSIGKPVCLSARSTEAAWRWHARYGHISFGSLRRLAQKEMVRGLPPLEQVEQVCDSCLAGKQ